MAGAMRKMAVYLGLVEDEETDDAFDEFDDADEPAGRRYAEPTPMRSAVRAYDEPATVSYAAPARRTATAPAPEPADDYRITTLHPRTYNEARTIGEHYREGVPVIMNLTEMDDADAKRLVDFAAGLVFALRGSVERVTAKVFLLTPPNVTITAEDKSRIAEGGFFNQS
jgi:cell division inhibitor SepF